MKVLDMKRLIKKTLGMNLTSPIKMMWMVLKVSVQNKGNGWKKLRSFSSKGLNFQAREVTGK